MDIVEKLRDDTKYCQCSFMDIYKPIEMEAADEIERLQAEIEEWKQAAGVEASERKRAHGEIEQLQEDLKDQKGKTIAAYKREAKWIENISNAKVDIERLREENEMMQYYLPENINFVRCSEGKDHFSFEIVYKELGEEE